MLRILTCLQYEHDYKLVALAAVVCVTGSWIALRLFSRARASSGTTRAGWLFLAGVAAGASIWTTHFIAMLAFQPALPSAFEPRLTILSLLISVAATGFGFAIASGHRLDGAPEIGGAVVGLGIGAMHFTGMAAYRVGGVIAWDPTLVAASIAIGTVMGVLALNRVARARSARDRHVAVALLTLAIVGLHFTAMGAVSIAPDPSAAIPERSISSDWLGLGIAAVALLVMGTGMASYLIDRRSRSETRSRIHHLAFHDPLTGLSNRAAFNEHLDGAIGTARARSGALALLCMDLNRFKEINDVFGHGAGDRVLAEAAQRMQAALRPGEFLARLGGDEFVAVQTSRPDRDAACGLADRLVDAFAERFDVDGRPMQIGISIGIARFPDDAADREHLLANADVAMYRAKSGGGGVCAFEPSMDEAVRLRRALSLDLAAALERDEFDLHYQVQTSVATAEICGFEALLRWRHGVRGSIPPAEFIPLAEETGLILAIGEWTLRRACRDAAAWKRPYKVAVNLSPLQVIQGDLPALVHTVLLDTGLAPARLELEITETTLMSDPDRALHVLRRLKALGVTVAMDDFGTGYSSLATLQSFPFDKIKLDRSFLRRDTAQHQAVAIVRAVLSLGKSLEIPVLAEGVETEEHLAFLRAERCDEVQGYLLGRPAPLAEIRHLVDGAAGDGTTREVA